MYPKQSRKVSCFTAHGNRDSLPQPNHFQFNRPAQEFPSSPHCRNGLQGLDRDVNVFFTKQSHRKSKMLAQNPHTLTLRRQILQLPQAYMQQLLPAQKQSHSCLHLASRCIMQPVGEIWSGPMAMANCSLRYWPSILESNRDKPCSFMALRSRPQSSYETG